MKKRRRKPPKKRSKKRSFERAQIFVINLLRVALCAGGYVSPRIYRVSYKLLREMMVQIGEKQTNLVIPDF